MRRVCLDLQTFNEHTQLTIGGKYKVQTRAGPEGGLLVCLHGTPAVWACACLDIVGRCGYLEKDSHQWAVSFTYHEVFAANFDDGALFIVSADTHGGSSCIFTPQLRNKMRGDYLRVHNYMF